MSNSPQKSSSAKKKTRTQSSSGKRATQLRHVSSTSKSPKKVASSSHLPASKKTIGSSKQRASQVKPKSVAQKASKGKKPKKSKKILGRNLMIFLTIASLGGLVGLGYYRNLNHQKLLEPGLEYLKAQETIDLTPISTKVDERNRTDALTRISDPNDSMSMWSLFKNTILMGDSRVYGFMSYGFLPENQVLAAAGYTINNIPEFEETIAAQQPSVIYLSYGVNDMGLNIGSNEGENGYQAVYERNIKALLEKSPNTKIFVNSIIEPTPEALAKNPNWNQVADFNRQIKEMCERNGWTYVDNSALSAGGTAPIYASDGVHFFSTFYEQWAKNMLMAQYQNV